MSDTWKTEGQRLLCLALREVTQVWLAEKLGAKQCTISQWAHSSKRPEPHWRRALLLFLGIPEAAWFTKTEDDAVDLVRERTEAADPVREKARLRVAEAVAVARDRAA